jgi:hypothetical protein
LPGIEEHMSVARLIRSSLCLCLAWCVSAGASPRVFPGDSFQVMLQAVSDPYLTVDGQIVRMNAAVVIYGGTNTTIVRGALQAQTGNWVRIEFDGACNVRRVWLLNDDEIVPVSTWASLFSAGFVPPDCPAAQNASGGAASTGDAAANGNTASTPTVTTNTPSTSSSTSSTTSSTTTTTTTTTTTGRNVSNH